MRRWKHRLTELNAQAKTATCSSCGPVLVKSNGPGKWRCRTAKKQYKYGAAYESPISGACPICKDVAVLVWDHCHRTGAKRGHICHRCNTVLGMARDRVDVLEAAIGYLATTSNQDENHVQA